MTEEFQVRLAEHRSPDECAPHFGTFREAVRYVARRYPGVEFAGRWHEWPPAMNGDECSELPFGDGHCTLGWLFHVRCKA